MKETRVSFTDEELDLLKAVALERDITIEEAAAQLVSEGIEKRFRKNTGKGPASNVRKFRNRKR